MTYLESLVHRLYIKYIRPHIASELYRQRLKLIWFVWGYWDLLQIGALPLAIRLHLIWNFIKIDWNIQHAHKPCEISKVCKAIAERPANPGEVVVEAGCWKGGSTTKLSLICHYLGYHLEIYDSFEGVEAIPEDGYDFSGEYAATEGELTENLCKFGMPEVCSIHKGWFAQTLKASPVLSPVRVVYIDCDLAKGTGEVLQGTVPSLVDDGWIFSQDYHIKSVRAFLHDPEVWISLGRPMPTLSKLCYNLAAIKL